MLTGLGLGTFVLYSTLRAFAGCGIDPYADAQQIYHVGHGTPALSDHAYLLSPFYSPLFAMPDSMVWISPAFLILWAPGGFRVTCYYYRKAYYRSFFLDPAGCAVGEPSSFCGFTRGLAYKGETRLLLFQNLHRFALYFALLFIPILYYDAGAAFFRHGELGVGVGTAVLLINATLLAGYTLGCHSLRHLVGGRDDCMSCGRSTGEGTPGM